MGVNFVLTGTAPLWATKTPPRGVAGVTSRTAHDYEPSAPLFGQFVDRYHAELAEPEIRYERAGHADLNWYQHLYWSNNGFCRMLLPENVF